MPLEVDEEEEEVGGGGVARVGGIGMGFQLFEEEDAMRA